MRISQLDHLVLTVADPERTVDFYTGILGMERVHFGDARLALRFGTQKINLHQAGSEYPPHAAQPVPGSADLCFLCDTPLADIEADLLRRHIAIEAGPLRRTGTNGPILSLYIRDPDGNLIELSNPLTS